MPNKWIEFVKDFREKNADKGWSYKQTLQEAKKVYDKTKTPAQKGGNAPEVSVPLSQLVPQTGKGADPNFRIVNSPVVMPVGREVMARPLQKKKKTARTTA